MEGTTSAAAKSKLSRLYFCVLSMAVAFSLWPGNAAAQSYKMVPASLSASVNAYVGLQSHSQPISITNTGSSSFTVSSFSLSGSPEFYLNYGAAPITLGPGQVANFAVIFVPTAQGTVTAQFTLNVSCLTSPIVVNLTGHGYTTSALPQLSVLSLNFGNVPVGTTSAPQSATVKNIGKANLSVNSISVQPPFTVSGNTGTLKPGQSASFNVTFTATAPGTFDNVLVVSYAGVPASGIDLQGTGVTPTSLGISTYATLPSATQLAAYSATLSASGGVGAVSWKLSPGTILPLGLSLSSAGILSGTLNSSVTVGNYSIGVMATDSNVPPDTATAQLTLPVDKPTGAACNNISWPLGNSAPPLVPITDLGNNLYLGYEGGLYPNGSNVRPPLHDADGVAIAQGIQPLDGNGNYDPNGKYALLSVGNSIAFDDFQQFTTNLDADPMKNSYLVMVPGAEPKAGAADLSSITSPYWATIQSYYLPQSGVTANQVVAAWIMDVIGNPTGTFPTDMDLLKADLESIAQNLHTLFPNLKLAYFTSRYYGGYSYGVRDPADTEPYAYQSAFAVKWAIEDQINGSPSLNYNPALGPVMAPWMSWADYDWANGLIPRSDGLVWSCQDIQSDGTHPSNPAGREKDTDMLLNFFKSDDTTVPWFLAPSS